MLRLIDEVILADVQDAVVGAGGFDFGGAWRCSYGGSSGDNAVGPGSRRRSGRVGRRVGNGVGCRDDCRRDIAIDANIHVLR